MERVTIDSSGRLALPQTAVRELGEAPLEVASLSARHLLLADEAGDGELVMAGRLGQIGVADLMSFFNMFRKTGILRFGLLGGARDLYFHQGEIVFAASTFPEDDLGETLCALGKVERADLQKLRQFVSDRAPIGKLLVDKGAVSAKDLWHATRYQVESIVYSLFAFEQGSFSFVAKALEDEEIVRLSMSTQNLIMEGLRRIDERAVFMRSIGSFDRIPVPDREQVEGLPPSALRLLQLVAARRYDVRDLLRRSGMGEFEGLRLLHQLLENKSIRLEEARPVAVEGRLGEVLSIYNGALTALWRRVNERNPAFSQEIGCFLRDLPQPFSYVFRDVCLRDDGTVDGARILANLAGLEEGDKEKLLSEALGELIYMECGVARRELGTAESAELIQRVQEVSRRVKTLIGRKE